ncbi:hypothetical protein RUND412_008610 [Rhizina undulata]
MATPPKPEGNPAFKAMGLPNFRAKLPSRNWSIFLTITAAIGAGIYHDRHEKKRLQSLWCSRVSHLSEQPLPPLSLPRKVTVYISAPPGDGISQARGYFKEYVKPVLVAAALDYDIVEGRRMGEIRVAVADGIRKRRRGEGEMGAVEELRGRVGVVREEGVGGVVVVGRSTWKEYVQGVHEGWLGPLEPPVEEPPSAVAAESAESPQVETPTEEPEKKEQEPKKEDPPKKLPVPSPYILPASYATVQLPSEIPSTLEPAGVVPHPHLLGFLNTPIRIYRYFRQRHLADAVCRETAAVALGLSRPFRLAESGEGEGETEDEIEALLKDEEKDWPKRFWKEESLQGEWQQPVVVDRRIGERMRRFVLPEGIDAEEVKDEEVNKE